MKALIRTADGSVEDFDGRVLFFSQERFIRDICEGECCFICGTHPDAATFEDEHVIPDWVLKRFKLHAKFVTLPNGVTTRYDKYKVPCCAACNDRLAEEFENRIAPIVALGSNAVRDWLVSGDGHWRLFCWLALIFLKTHLKDKSFRAHLDERRGQATISSAYEWETLHHLHCVARAFFTKAHLAPEVFGSLLVLPARVEDYFERFDYGDLYEPQTLLLKIDATAFICVLNDAGAARVLFQNHLQRITGALSPLQLREVAAHFAYLSVQLKNRPEFWTHVSGRDGTVGIMGSHDASPDLHDYDAKLFGKLMHRNCAQIIEAMQLPDGEEILSSMLAGRWSFLFDEKGVFIPDQMTLRPKTG